MNQELFVCMSLGLSEQPPPSRPLAPAVAPAALTGLTTRKVHIHGLHALFAM